MTQHERTARDVGRVEKLLRAVRGDAAAEQLLAQLRSTYPALGPRLDAMVAELNSR